VYTNQHSISDIEYQVSIINTRYSISSVYKSTLNIEYQVSGNQHSIFDIEYQVSIINTRYSISSIRYPEINTQYSISSIEWTSGVWKFTLNIRYRVSILILKIWYWVSIIECRYQISSVWKFTPNIEYLVSINFL